MLSQIQAESRESWENYALEGASTPHIQISEITAGCDGHAISKFRKLLFYPQLNRTGLMAQVLRACTSAGVFTLRLF